MCFLSFKPRLVMIWRTSKFEVFRPSLLRIVERKIPTPEYQACRQYALDMLQHFSKVLGSLTSEITTWICLVIGRYSLHEGMIYAKSCSSIYAHSVWHRSFVWYLTVSCITIGNAVVFAREQCHRKPYLVVLLLRREECWPSILNSMEPALAWSNNYAWLVRRY